VLSATMEIPPLVSLRKRTFRIIRTITARSRVAFFYFSADAIIARNGNPISRASPVLHHGTELHRDVPFSRDIT